MRRNHAKAGKEAVARAMLVLKTYYEKAATNTALIQSKSKGKVPGAPATFDKPYTGMEGGGVMGMLEVCESDFARLESETTSEEEANAAAHKEFMEDSKTRYARLMVELDYGILVRRLMVIPSRRS